MFNQPTVLISLIAIAASVTILSYFSVASIKRWLVRRGVVDTPNHRTLHDGEVPRGGGVVLVTMIVLACLSVGMWFGFSQVYLGLAFMAMAWAGLSFADDVFDLTPAIRLICHLILASITVFLFGWVSHLSLGETVLIHLSIVGVFLTIVGIVWMANLFNFMDGMDGMAGTQTLIASLTLAFWFFNAGGSDMAFICFLLACATLGFLVHNWRPASIFMGDVGSITLGGVFALLALIADNRYQIPILTTTLLFSVFIFDATVTFVRRALKGQKVWQAHRHHYYQRLALAGLAHDRIVMIYGSLMGIASLLASLALLYPPHAVVALGSMLLILTCCALVIERRYPWRDD